MRYEIVEKPGSLLVPRVSLWPLLFWRRMNLPNTFNSFKNVSSYTLNMKNICDDWLMRTHIGDLKKKILVNFFITFGPFTVDFRQVLAVFSYQLH